MKQKAIQREQDAAESVYRFVLIIILIAALVFVITATSYAGDDARAWTKTDTALQAIFLLTLAVDRAQTEEFVRHPRSAANEEVGWAHHFVGAHPSVGQVNGYNAACALLHTAIAGALPKPYSTIWQSFWIGVEVNTVDSNVNAGISLRF